MMPHLTCLKCGSDSQAHMNVSGDLVFQRFETAKGDWLPTIIGVSPKRALICGNCGFVELYIDAPEHFYNRYSKVIQAGDQR
jgi:predicted nucleic-acid-binding Zn-ribbon protein